MSMRRMPVATRTIYRDAEKSRCIADIKTSSAGEMAQWVRSLAVRAWGGQLDPPSTHVKQQCVWLQAEPASQGWLTECARISKRPGPLGPPQAFTRLCRGTSSHTGMFPTWRTNTHETRSVKSFANGTALLSSILEIFWHFKFGGKSKTNQENPRQRIIQSSSKPCVW